MTNKEWKEENTISVFLRLNKEKDKDIIDYLSDKNKASVIKDALRKEIKND